MKTCQVITSINQDTGGPAVSVSRLAQELATTGFDSHLLTLNYPSLGPQMKPIGATVHSIEAGRLTEFLKGQSQQMHALLEKMAPGLSCIHNHGLWMFPNWYARCVAKKYNIPLIISPRGMLDEWSMHRRRLRKNLAWRFFERDNMLTARLIHATSTAEAESIRNKGFIQPIAVIPNGVDIPDLTITDKLPRISELFPSLSGKRCILFLSRIHPKKGLKALIRSWNKIFRNHPEWHLVISGPDTDGHRSEIESMILSMGQEQAVTFTGPVTGSVKSALLFQCELMVLPTHSENFGIVVAEALAHSLPVITTHAAPWKELTSQDCGWWIEDTEEALTAALSNAIATTSDLRRAMGNRGRELVSRKYSWKTVGQQMHDTYHWLCKSDSRLNELPWILQYPTHDSIKRLRITIATGPMFPVPAILGGAVPKIWQGLAEKFADKGHDVTIAARVHPSQPTREIVNGVKYRRLGGYNQSRYIYYDLLRDFWYALRLRSQLPQADILVSNDFWLPILTAKHKKWGKVVVNCGRYPKNQYHLYRNSDCLAAVSTAVADAIVKQTPLVSNIVQVLPNPVDINRFSSSIPRSEKARKSILYVGRIHPEKGIHLLIKSLSEVLHHHPDASLRIVGPYHSHEGGGGERYFKQLKADSQNLPVEFTGPIYNEELLAKVYHEAGVFCYPSLAEEGEAFGVAPLEAMASGLAPIVSKLACFSDFIFNGVNGFEFDHRASDPVKELTSVLCLVFDDAITLSRVENQALVTANKYDYSHVADAYLNVFRKLLDQNSLVDTIND